MRRLPPPATVVGPALAPPEDLQAQAEAIAELDKGAESLLKFERACGGRQKFIDALSPQADPSIRDLVAMLQDHRFKGRSLGWIADKCGLSLTRVMQAYSSGIYFRMHIATAHQVAAGIEPVVQHILDHSVPYTTECPDCNGTGKIDVEKKRTPSNACKACHGVGKRTVEPNIEHQKMALDLAQLSPKAKGGPMFQQQINIGDTPATVKSSDPRAGGLERLHQAIGKILYDKNTVIDISPEDPSEP